MFGRRFFVTFKNLENSIQQQRRCDHHIRQHPYNRYGLTAVLLLMFG
jgi:hypothetical protein